MTIVSVVRDFGMYDRLVRNNPFNRGATFYPVDNREKNEGVPVGYNSFLNQFDYSKEQWFIFCHEDWEIQEAWFSKIEGLDIAAIYGPVGTVMLGPKKIVLGRISNSCKDGTGLRTIGIPCKTGTEVGTFDCQCLIIHSSSIRKWGLRFDEELPFDLYIEEFCMNAFENYGMASRIVSLQCQHYSFGTVQPRFFDGAHYIRNKYPNLSRYYSTSVENIVWMPVKRGRFWGVPWCYASILLLRFCYQSKVTASGYWIIKICKIPVYRKRVVFNT
jgi:hypothetical protein